ncbi:unnamed protein product, partial [Prorocentrum cordatum]
GLRSIGCHMLLLSSPPLALLVLLLVVALPSLLVLSLFAPRASVAHRTRGNLKSELTHSVTRKTYPLIGVLTAIVPPIGRGAPFGRAPGVALGPRVQGALVPNMARQGGGPRAGLRAARRAAGALRPTVLHPGRRVPAGARRGEAAGARRGGPKPVAEPRPRGGDRALRASAAAAGGRQGCARCPPAVRGRAEK